MNINNALLVLSLSMAATQVLAGSLQQRIDSRQNFDHDVTPWSETHNQGVVRQKLDASCGAAALATILKNYYGLDVTEEDMMRAAEKKEWFSFADMVVVLKDYDFKGVGIALSFEQLKKINVPAIVFIKTRSLPHFAVLRSIGDDHVVLADPAHGNNRYPIDKFLEKWNTRDESNYSGKILVPIPLVTAKELNINKDYFNNSDEINDLAKKFSRIKRTVLFH